MTFLRLILTIVFSVIPSISAFAEVKASPAVIIPLDKQYVPVHRDGRIVSQKTAYFGKIFVGSPAPQNLTVVFDTGSGHFFLPSISCKTEACQRHKRYDQSLSSSAFDIDLSGQRLPADADERDKVAISFGTGEVTGEFVQELFCLQEYFNLTEAALPQDCAKVRMITATELTEEPFGSFHFDGVLGLGLQGLAVEPQFSVFEQLARKGGSEFHPSFGYFLSRDDTVASEMSFGGHDPRRIASDLQWTPVHNPQLGFWQVKVLHVFVDGEILPLCEDGSCVAVADTGSSLIGVPREAAPSIHKRLARKVPDSSTSLDCRDFPGPELVFELAAGVRLSLGAQDYSRPATMRVENSQTKKAQFVCRASLLPVDKSDALGEKVFILGEPLLYKYYTAYDWQERKVGFALAKTPQVSPYNKPIHRIYGTPFEAKPVPKLLQI